MYLGFWLADAIYYSGHKYEFLFYRIFFCMALCAAYFHNKKNKSFEKNQYWQIVFSTIGSILICYMMYRTEGPSSIYYNGLNLVAIMSLMFATYKGHLFYVALGSIYIPYYILCALQLDSFQNIQQLIVYSIFNIGTIAAVIFSRREREKNILKLIQAQYDLEEELRLREEIIKQKTAESVKLNQLSAQFSPQVVEAIKNGQINLDASVKRAQICAIFIDIVNSTERVVKLDQDKVQITLARFLDTVLTTFLKYDLTIDKFHGDGVLAFANSPVSRQDFIERTCMAAVEARRMLSEDQEFYVANWGSHMQVRVGISTGFANVGFYGDRKYFKTFSAIGAPLPFASRLTSIAQPDQILIDSAIAECLLGQNFTTRVIGQRILKGFDTDTNIVHELTDQIKDNELGQNKKCPSHPDSILYLDTNEKGHFVFKCRDCGFSETDQSSENGSDYFAKRAS
jgi:adenylate cyclase